MRTESKKRGNKGFLDLLSLIQSSRLFACPMEFAALPVLNNWNKYNKIHNEQELVQQNAQRTSETQGIIN
jgi:hypothetical protein